ncbi:polysaccharide pyruvyl transferase family protein [Streptomyces klenkii]|uniref:polysaccharide pyruvyl transferase family protein n=1 Tax=Streptomyces klenkii TaxID=1420899 RepID=UPI0033A7A065
MNFGDYLAEILYEALFSGRMDWIDGQIWLIGSVISDNSIQSALSAGYPRIVYWGCGMREPVKLSPRLRAAAIFRGVRGPLTRTVLGLPPDTPIGDPGLLLPRFYLPAPAPEYEYRTLCMRHVHTAVPDADLLKKTGAELVVTPWIVPDRGSCRRLIDAIAAAGFVLTASLHGAIVAYAYGTPFAFLRADRIDVPFKWADFAKSIGFECEFVTNVNQGIRFYEQNSKAAKVELTLDSLLAAAPLQGHS